MFKSMSSHKSACGKNTMGIYVPHLSHTHLYTYTYTHARTHTCTHAYALPPTKKKANPAIQAVSDVVNIEAGSSGQLKVYVSGIPDPSSTAITWFKLGPGGTMTELKEPTVNFSSDHRTLLLTNVQDSNGGTYMCAVAFPTTSVSSTLNINVSSASTLKGENDDVKY